VGHLKTDQHWPEMAFSMKVSALDSAWLDHLIATQVLIGQPRQAMQPRQLEGMLTGFMDLVLEFEGRYYVLDYKSSVLGPDDAAYTPEAMRKKILEERYELQYVLYLLALHRHLKSRLPGYRYEEHVGGAVYVFLRGLMAESQGLHVERPPAELIDALDRMLSPDLPRAA